MALLVIIFYYFSFIIPTDIPLHAQFIKDYAYGNKPFQVNFLYYITVYALSFFSSKTSALLVISVYVLSAITFFKYNIVKKIINSEMANTTLNTNNISSLTAFLLLFCFSLPSILILQNYYYLLHFPANVWHNSTTIFAMPFVILLFWTSLQQLTEFKQKRLFWISVLIVLNILIKPSFVFVYILAYPLLLLKKHKLSKLFWINLTPILISFVLILIEYYFIFESKPEQTTNATIVIDFFHYLKVWGQAQSVLDILKIISSTLLSGFLFPILLLTKNKQLLKLDMIQFALISVTVGVLISYTFCETGDRAFDGNFLWQNYMSTFLLFMVCAIQLLKLVSKNPNGFKAYRIETIAFLLHFMATIVYFSKIISTQSYF